METLAELLSYPFLTRALLVGSLVSVCAALLGVTLVLKKSSMIGDGLSHVSFGALSVAAAFGWAPLAVCIPVTVAAAFAILSLSSRARVSGDSSVALFSTTALAAGVMVTSLVGGLTTDVTSYLFGSILAMKEEDVALSLILGAGVLLVFLLCYHRIFAVTFDESVARATLPHAGLYHALIAVLTAVTVVLGMRMMGALLLSSLILFPALTAMRLCRRYRSVVLSAAGLSLGSFVTGLLLSFLFNTPVGATIVLVDALLFGLFSLIGALRREK